MLSNLASEEPPVQLCSPTRNSMDCTWRTIVRDPDRLDGIVDAVARCMAHMLCIQDPEIDNGKTPFGRTLYEEREHLPTRGQIDEVERIDGLMAFVKRGFATANEMASAAFSNRTNVLLARFSDSETFDQAVNFTRKNSLLCRGGEGRAQLAVGGLRHLLYVDVATQVQRWLTDCDAKMMIAAQDTVADESADEQVAHQLIVDLATSIASRLTLSPEDGNALLSTEQLHARALKEINATAADSNDMHCVDLEALKTLYLLAKEGVDSPVGEEILQNRLEFLQHLIHSPPVELGLQGVNAQHMNLRLFARACAPDLDAQVRVEMLRQWRQTHGAFAVTAASQAIQKLKLWSVTASTPPTFCKVLYTPEEEVPAGAADMPRMAFVHTPRAWKLVTVATPRTAYDWTRRRCVRLASLVLQLLGHGALERGVVSSRTVEPVATQAALTARVVLRLLEQKREQFSLGTRLVLQCSHITDKESHLCADVADALAHVSRFSMLELLSVFSRESPAMRVILPELSFRTRCAMGNFQSSPVVPKRYHAFAYDVMPFVLKRVSQRRNHLGVPPTQATNPMCGLLRALPAARDWHPINGTLRLTMDDLQGGPSLLPDMLREMARRGLLCEHKRPYDPVTKRKAAKLAFVFDSAQLVAVLSGYPLAQCV